MHIYAYMHIAPCLPFASLELLSCLVRLALLVFLLLDVSRGSPDVVLMPPKVVRARGGHRGSVAVGPTHPAKVAEAKKNAAGGGDDAVTHRTSPPRGAKNVANAKIAAQLSPAVRIPVASIASAVEETTPGVTAAPLDDSLERSPKRAKNASAGAVDSSPGGGIPVVPPLWNAWYSNCCRILHYVGDGGALLGKCGMCGEVSPERHHTMLDPDQVSKLRSAPMLTFEALMGVVAFSNNAASSPTLSKCNPRGSARKSPMVYTEIATTIVAGGKTTGLDDDAIFPSSPEASSIASSNEESVLRPTDLEVSRFSFFDRLSHYMERHLICEENRGTVELAVMVEAGSIVREMGTMTKEKREAAYFDEYLHMLREIPDEMFFDESIRGQMMKRFKGMRKGEMDAGCLLRKYETELSLLKKFAYKFPGFGSLNKLPSGTPQLQHLRQPVVAKLWAENNPVSSSEYDFPFFVYYPAEFTTHP